jgi:tetratricopeptide (TPR) repeat protein
MRTRIPRDLAVGTMVALAMGALAAASRAADRRETYDWTALPPDVAEFIAGTYFAHAAEFPDPGEPLAVLRLYLDQDELFRQGRLEEAIALFRGAAKAFPQARHAQAGLARALWRRYRSNGSREDLKEAVAVYRQAHLLGLRNGRIRYTELLSEGFGSLGETAPLRDVFEPLLADHPSDPVFTRDYASGLARAGAPDAEVWLRKSLQLRPEGGPIEPVTEYGQWLIARDRYQDALQVLRQPPDEEFPIVSFFRGYAAERSGQLALARIEYARAARFTESFPVSEQYRTDLASEAGVRFAGDPAAAHTCTGKIRLSEVIYCESRGESGGGQRAVGWTLRTRVFRGTEQSGCTIDNSGDTLCAKYRSVAEQSGQFCGDGSGNHDSTTDTRAEHVLHGDVPDPYITGGWCPAGSVVGSNKCTATCSQSTTQGANVNGPEFFYSTTGSCAATHPSGCGSVPRQTCSDGGSDHCFYRVP